MFSFSSLVRVVALTLTVSVLVSATAASGDSPEPPDPEYRLPEPEVKKLLERRVLKAELMMRPLEKRSFCLGLICHSGVRVTLEDGALYLIQKRKRRNLCQSHTGVYDATKMEKWTLKKTKVYKSRHTVAELLLVAGDDYDLLLDNCHKASRAMMALP